MKKNAEAKHPISFIWGEFRGHSSDSLHEKHDLICKRETAGSFFVRNTRQCYRGRETSRTSPSWDISSGNKTRLLNIPNPKEIPNQVAQQKGAI